MDLGKGAFGMWAFKAHDGLSKPTVGFQKYGGRFSGEKKPAAAYPQVKCFQKYGGLVSGKKKRLRQRTHKLGASRNMGDIFLKKKKRLRQRSQTYGASKNMGARIRPMGHPGCDGPAWLAGLPWNFKAGRPNVAGLVY